MSQKKQQALTRLKNLLNMPRRGKPMVGRQVAATPSDVVHKENKWRLLRYRARRDGLAHKTPILLIPSLINRWYVLDLMPGKSFAEFLVSQGFDVYIIDWGTPTDEDRYLTFDDICDRYIGRAVRRCASLAGVEKIHILGYCLGGTLATIYAARRPEHVATLLPLATPVDFSDDGILATWVNNPSFDIDALVDATGLVPWPLMQAAFHMLKPTLNLSKTTYLLDRAWDDAFLDGFFAIETWSNDNVSFPGECYRYYIKALYQQNALIQGQLSISGQRVQLKDITCPMLLIGFEHDHIVPMPSTAPLMDAVCSKDKTFLRLGGGHVGAVVSRKASRTLWPQITTWFGERDHLGLS